MKKALRIISVVSGIVCVVSAVVLVFAYLEDAIEGLQKIKRSVTNKINERKALEAEFNEI